MESCRYTKKHGTFTIALAVAFREHGLSISYFSEPDSHPNPIEKRCYRIAEKLGVQMNGPTSLKVLLAQVSSGRVPVVLYNTSENNGHLTPVLGIQNGNLILPYSDEGFMPRREFLRRWSEPEIFKQCVVAYQ